MASYDTYGSREEEEKCWRHPFHHKLLTLEFVGYLITDTKWRDEILKLNKEGETLKILKGQQDERAFKDFVKAFNELNYFEEFVNSTEENSKDKPIFAEKCRKEIETQYSRYRQLWDKKVPDRGKKYASGLNVTRWVQDLSQTAGEKTDTPPPLSEIPPTDLEEEIKKRVMEASNEFKIVFGRRDHHLVASLVETLWDMREEGEIRLAYVPREQLLSVDMEDREIREVTLQLHPNKPVYRQRDKDEMRGFEEEFVGVTPWCRVPGGRYLSRVIDDVMYEEISGMEMEEIWIEDEWLMSERKRIHREERKRDKDKTPVKVTDPYDQVNHYLPILKEVSGFRGLIRDDAFYEGLQGLIYILQVARVEEPADLLTHTERLTREELQFRRDLREMKRERETETKTKS